MDVSSILLTFSFIVVFYFILNLLKPRLDPREPPGIPAKVPVVGHILGLIRHGTGYHARISAKHPLPAFTLDLLFTKVYVINSAGLLPAIQRNSKTISFDPLLTNAAKRLAGVHGKGLKLLQEVENGGGGLNTQVVHAMQPALLGSGLDTMNKSMINNLQISIEELQATQNDPLDLHNWCRQTMTIASTDAVYGPLNPYKSKDIENAFWDFESNLSILILNIVPQLTARKAFKAREKLITSFMKYYNAGGHEKSSLMTYGRWKTQLDAGATTEDIARLESALGVGILSNTVPSTFWTLFEIYSRPKLLADLREEVQANAMHLDVSNSDTITSRIIDLADIRDRCPLLVSTFQEVLRLRSNGAPTRFVYQDVVMNDQYLFKAGAMIQMPAQSINRESSTWGSTSHQFDPSRFSVKGHSSENKRVKGYMSFGTSPNICPGRHFASGEILAMVAMLLLRYDITPVSGRWDQPKLNMGAVAASVSPPAEEFRVKFSPRQGFEGGNWAFRVTEGKGRFNLITS